MWSWLLWCALPASGAKLERVLDEVLADVALEGAAVSIRVESAAGQERYDRGGDVRLVPASTMKWITAIAAAHTLGMDWTFETRLDATGWVEGDALHGDVVLVGGGDPSLAETSPVARMDEAASLLAGAGIRSMTGDVVVDPGIVGDPPLGAGWMWDDVPFDFSAPHGGVNVAHNLDAPGLEDCARRGARGSPLADPSRCAGLLLKAALERAGVRVAGDVRVGRGSRGGTELARWSSPPLSVLLATMLDRSDNLYAECIARALDPIPPRRFASARDRLIEVLDSAGVPQGSYRLADGSGLSRYGLLSAETLVSATRWAQSQPWGPDLVASLPVAGHGGTLANRMRGTSAEGRVRGKTGSMSGVRNLVGVVEDADGAVLRFAILFNGLTVPQSRAIAVQDRVLVALALSRRGRVRPRDSAAVWTDGG